MIEVIDNILVIKVGTNALIKRAKDGSECLDVASFERISNQVISLQEKGNSILLVSSAAITAGMVEAGLSKRPNKETDIVDLQRLASIGWRHVLNAWANALSGKVVGELLLTQRELGSDGERNEALQVIHALLKNGNIAIVNENDAITHEEIAFGDNDTLAATLAAKIRHSKLFGSRVKLILLSDIDGVYEDVTDTDSIIRSIKNISDYEHFAQQSHGTNGTGGMVSKFSAARIANNSGVDMWVGNGRTEDVVRKLLHGESGTHFIA